MKTLTKSILALSLALSFLFAGIFSFGTSYLASTNEGLLLAHDGPHNDMMVY